MAKLPSPCIDVCKYKRAGHCIACSMTKPQKKMFKSLKSDRHRRAFVELLTAQQRDMGRFTAWEPAYRKKCAKKGVRPPLPAA
ncbi:MAG: DUF1289 domain-containing protein [Pseudomonadota bacterium]